MKRRPSVRYQPRYNFPLSDATKALILNELKRAEIDLIEAEREVKYREAMCFIAEKHYEITRSGLERFPEGRKVLELFDGMTPDERKAYLDALPERLARRGRMGRPHGGFSQALRDLSDGERLFRHGYKNGSGQVPTREGCKLRSEWDEARNGRWYWWEALVSA